MTAHDAPTFDPYRPADTGCRAPRPKPRASPRQLRPGASPEPRQQRPTSCHNDRSASSRTRLHSRSAPPKRRGTLTDRSLGRTSPATIPIARPPPRGFAQSGFNEVAPMRASPPCRATSQKPPDSPSRKIRLPGQAPRAHGNAARPTGVQERPFALCSHRPSYPSTPIGPTPR
jgi:hypothetical protein